MVGSSTPTVYPSDRDLEAAKRILAANNQRVLAECKAARVKVKAILAPLEPWQRDSIIKSLTYYTDWSKS